MPRKIVFASAFFALFAATAWAQPEPYQPGSVTAPVRPPAAPGESRRMFEVSTGFQNLSGGFGDWRDLTVRGTFDMQQHVVQGEASVMRRFHENGAFIGVGDTYTFNPDWYGSLSVGFGDGAFYLPRFRIDGSLNRKFLADRRLVGSLGLGYYDAPDGHTDRSVTLGAIYYFTAPWVAEGGVRFNSSNPGSVHTHQQYLAATWGRDKQDQVSARYMWGGEGYQTVAEQTQLVNFKSREATLTWRHWFNPRTGVLVGASRYSNPLYRRTGINAGVFHNF